MAKPGFEGAKFVCSPPLRTPITRRSSGWACARRPPGRLHRPRAVQLQGQKDLGKGDFSKIPNGLPSVEDRFTLLYGGVEAGHIDLNRFVELVGDRAGQDVRPVPAQGNDRAGSDADIVVFDPNVERTISS